MRVRMLRYKGACDALTRVKRRRILTIRGSILHAE